MIREPEVANYEPLSSLVGISKLMCLFFKSVRLEHYQPQSEVSIKTWKKYLLATIPRQAV